MTPPDDDAPWIADELHVLTPADVAVRITRTRWELISTRKHPVMSGRLSAVLAALSEPDAIRRSSSAEDVLLFYRSERPGRWICAVVKRLDGTGFLVSAYPASRMKEGEELWPR